MTRKKVQFSESTMTEATHKTGDYLNEISTFYSTQLHFFNKTGVIKTSGLCYYG